MLDRFLFKHYMITQSQPLKNIEGYRNFRNKTDVNSEILMNHNKSQNWVDDIPACPYCDIGTKSKVQYNLDKTIQPFPSEDRYFGFKDNNVKDLCLYAVIDGHGGTKTADFMQQNLPIELNELFKHPSEGESFVQKLPEVFINISNGFTSNIIGESLCHRTNLKEQIPKDMEHNDALERYPSLFKNLANYEEDINVGCAATVALIHNKQLFVANVGDVRALLCRQETESEEIVVTQVTIDHTTKCLSELERFVQLGLGDNLEELQGSDFRTRSIGDYKLHKEYKDIELLSKANGEPIISTPSVHGGEQINEIMKFLVIMSHGFYKTFQEAYGCKTRQVNNDIAQKINEELSRRENLKGVAQVIVDGVCNSHENKYKASSKTRDDMTLLIRSFNDSYKTVSNEISKQLNIGKKADEKRKSCLPPLIMPERTKKPNDDTSSSAVSTPSSTGSITPTTVTPGTPGKETVSKKPFNSPFTQQPLNKNVQSEEFNAFPAGANEDINQSPLLSTTMAPSLSTVVRNDTSVVLDNHESVSLAENRVGEGLPPLEIDKDGKVKPYVDFSLFHKEVEGLGGEAIVFKDFI